MGHYPVIKILPAFILGIIIGMEFGDFLTWIWVIPLLIFVLMIILYLFPEYRVRWLFGCCALSGSVMAGYCWEVSRNDISENDLTGAEIVLAARMLTDPVEKPRSYQCYAELFLPENGSLTRLNALVYFDKESNKPIPRYGHMITAFCEITAPGRPVNPGDFDFSKYLESKGIRHVIYLDDEQWHYTELLYSNPVFVMASFVHDRVIDALSTAGLSDRDLGIASAMILGDKGLIDRDLNSTFADAGAVHILCVSGLHVGIIYMISNLLFSFIRTSRYRMVPVVLTIWSFALVTGLSPPVMRAAVMFTAISCGNLAQRDPNIFNTIAFSALVLLLIEPAMILQPGFRLSYSAVLGIVIFQPFIVKIWMPRWTILRKAWELSAVSIGAQLGTLPFSLFYFGQFPNYFLLTNLLVIPLTAAIIYSGLLLTFFKIIGITVLLIDQLFALQLRFLRLFVNGVSELPGSVTKLLWIDTFSAAILFIVILCLSVYVVGNKKGAFLYALLMMVMLTGHLTFVKYQNLNKSELAIYSTNRGLLMGLVDSGSQYFVHDSLAMQDPWSDNIIRSHKQYALEHEITTLGDLSREVATGTGDFFIFDHMTIYIASGRDEVLSLPLSVTVDILVIRSGASFKIMEKLDDHQVGTIVLLKELRKKEKKRWIAWCREKGVPFFDILEKGAYISKKKHGTYIPCSP